MKLHLLIATACASLALFSTSAHSAVVVEYDIANANGSLSSSVNTAATATGVTASTMIATGNLGGGFPYLGTFMFLQWPAPALNPTMYFEFSVTPAVGYQVQYQSVDFAAMVGGSGSNWTMEVHASLDGFATSDIPLFTQSIARDSSAHIFNGLDISALGTQSATVTFRYYMYRPAASQQGWAGLIQSNDYGPAKNFFVNGIVTGPPLATEPTTWGRVKALYMGE